MLLHFDSRYFPVCHPRTPRLRTPCLILLLSYSAHAENSLKKKKNTTREGKKNKEKKNQTSHKDRAPIPAFKLFINQECNFRFQSLLMEESIVFRTTMPPISIIIIPKSQPASHLKAVLPLPSQQSDQEQVKTHQMNADNLEVYLSGNFFPPLHTPDLSTFITFKQTSPQKQQSSGLQTKGNPLSFQNYND